jgi:hypothetical protein
MPIPKGDSDDHLHGSLGAQHRGRAQADCGGDWGEEWLGMIEQVVGDEPGQLSRHRGLQDRPSTTA